MTPRHLLPAVLLASAVCGCGDGGPSLAAVEGTVLMDGLPLMDAEVRFTPAAGGRPSLGVTDYEGRYRLRYSPESEGALLGTHTVSVSTAPLDESGAEDAGSRRRERVPVKYNARTTLTFEVAADGHRSADFSLDSGKSLASGAR